MTEKSGFQVGHSAPVYYEAQVTWLMAPFVEALVDATVSPGNSVLDVACGTGFATRAAASVAGPGTRIEGSDLNPAMVAMARTVPDASGANLGWSEASALALPFAEGEFDAAICQQGIQFFPDPSAGVREMARVTAPGGRVGVTAWSASEDSPFLHRETDMLASHGGGKQAGFSADEDQIHSWFTAGGLGEITIDKLVFEVDLPPVSIYVPEHLKALPWSAGFFDLPAEQQKVALAELDEALAEYRTADGIRVPFSSYLATATV